MYDMGVVDLVFFITGGVLVLAPLATQHRNHWLLRGPSWFLSIPWLHPDR